MAQREGLASANLGATRAIGQRLAEDARVVDRLVSLGAAGMASGIDDGFDIDAFVDAVRLPDLGASILKHPSC